MELARKGVRRAQTEEEKKLAAEVAAAREKVEGGGGGPEAAAALKAKEAELSALCLQVSISFLLPQKHCFCPHFTSSRNCVSEPPTQRVVELCSHA